MPRAQPEPNTGPRGEPGDFEEIQVPNKLLRKVGPGVGANPAAIEKAEKVVEQLKGVYEERLELEIEDLLSEFQGMRDADAYDLDLLHDRVHEIRGEAGTYSYDLVSDIGKLLCELLSPMQDVGPDQALAINTHLNAMQTVVAKKVTGAGPEVARQIVQGLHTIVVKSNA